MSFPRHRKYNNSGVDWFSEVPTTWSVHSLRHCLSAIFNGLSVDQIDASENTVPVTRIETISSGAVDLERVGFIDRTLAGADKRLRPGDILFSNINSLNVIGNCAIYQGDEELYAGMNLLLLRPSAHYYPEWLYWLIRSVVFRQVVEANAKPAINQASIPQGALKAIRIPVPQLNEQREIAEFLGHETAKVDALIEEQRKLIELLKEKRQAVISHAVTKGLNPDAPLKPSGIDWIGDVPAHWEVTKFGRAISYQEGPGIMAADFQESGVPLIRVSGVQGRWASLHGCNFLSPEKAEGKWKHFRLNLGDLLISASASMGTVCEVGEDAVGAIPYTGLIRLNPIAHRATKDYIRAMLESYLFEVQVDQLRAGATIQHFGPTHLSQMCVTLPPISEQAQIASYIDEHSSRVQALIGDATQAIDLLQERRSALISAAVTGKINVTTQVAKPVRSTWSPGFARKVIAAEALSRCNGPRMGRIKLQKLIHLCEFHAQLDEVNGTYGRHAAGPFAPQVMEDVREGLLQQRWFEEYKDGSRYAYRALEKAGEHKRYLGHWKDKQTRIDHVLNLLGGELTEKCGIVSTLYAAWNDLLIDGKTPTDAEIIHEASSAERWHESKEKIAVEKWPEALRWMRKNGLVPVGYGTHTMHQPDLFAREGHEPA